MAKTIIEVETKTFTRFWLVILGIAIIILLIFKASTALIIIGISIFLALALRPLVATINRLFYGRSRPTGKHKTLSAVFAYIIVVIIFGIILAIVGPVVVSETSKFVQQLPTQFDESANNWEQINALGQQLGIENLQEKIMEGVSSLITSFFGNLSTIIVSGVSSIANVIINVVLVLILTLLFMLEGPKINYQIWKYFNDRSENSKYYTAMRNTVSRMTNVVSTFVSHQVLIALIDGTATALIVFILSLIFGFDSGLAIPMGLIAVVFYLIPMFGQFINGCLVTIILAFSNPVAAIVFAITYILYTQIENNVISPKIQGAALKLPPVIVLCATIIGIYIGGILGAIIAVPIAGCIRIFVQEYPKIKAAKNSSPELLDAKTKTD